MGWRTLPLGFGGVFRLKLVKNEAVGKTGSELGSSGGSELLLPASSISTSLRIALRSSSNVHSLLL